MSKKKKKLLVRISSLPNLLKFKSRQTKKDLNELCASHSFLFFYFRERERKHSKHACNNRVNIGGQRTLRRLVKSDRIFQ
jgi:hypothetical protein